ncbi:MAG: biopolymer transporter ExbD [Prevotella sp.]|nr:biopolymer transporter ExbD [Prevotella sp.]
MKLRRGVFRRRERKMPGLNTAALPDLIFTVLFFFMIVTHMRDVDLLVHYDLPNGTEVQKLAHKSAVTQIYVGRQANLKSQSSNLNSQINRDTFFIQLNNRLATIADIRDYVEEERSRMNEEDRSRMVVSLKADRDVPMSIIAEIKQALQQSFALRINYSATEAGKSKIR